MYYFTKGILCFIAFFAMACGQTPGANSVQLDEGQEDERLIQMAEIDGHSISVGLFKKTYVEFLTRTGANDTDENRTKHLQALVDAYLLGKNAEQLGVAKDTSFDQYMDRQRKKAVGGRYYETVVVDQVPDVTDEEVREAYRRFNEKVHVRHLFFKREHDALEAYERLMAGEDFVRMANEVFNTTAYDTTAGDLGIISYFSVDDAFAEAVFSLKERHTFTRPVRSRVGFHIIRLENRFSNALLTESAFQAKRQGIFENVHLRQVRLQGDAFVRDFMDQLNYEVNRDAMYALADAIGSIAHTASSDPMALSQDEGFSLNDVQTVRAALRPESVLVAYEWQGQPRVFTAGEYYNWLEDLPFQEALSNPAASVGRALRNEVLALAGEEAGLISDPIVQESVQHESMMYLARRIRERLRGDTTQVPTPAMIERAFDRVARDRSVETKVDWWVIPVSEFEDAQYIVHALKDAEEDPRSFAGYHVREGYDISLDKEWMVHLKQAPIGMPVLAGLQGNRWYVFSVMNREVTTYSKEDVYAQLERQLAPFASEYYALNDLYKTASIEVDTLRLQMLVQ